ncbi:ABSCISIC ACID-INSENSITIVE 5-like protein 3 isoform X2 [Tasmannia lanceolata]|uniref:ABSCISIC ACID-INSENSITIVE 5-like protein 3 isoform X2 n=1 Tax=Tasmannia lanceolata TaxID=3420 RepID=UPI0040632110
MGLKIMVSPNRGQAPHFPPLARQGSLYNLTLEEVQNQLGDLGKPLNSMNLHELVKNVVAAEESLVFHNPHIGDGSVSSHPSSSASCLPGNINLSRTLSQKTVDEVLRDIMQHDQGNAGDNGSMLREPTLGEMTLEDFLHRAGAINMGNQDILVNSQPLMAMDPMVSTTQHADWLQYQMAAVHPQPMTVLRSSLSVAPQVFGNQVMDVGFNENQLALRVPVPMMGGTSSESLAIAEKKQRFSGEVMEKSIERRQKRMIKNRESAARSRGRKQKFLFWVSC